MDAKELRKQAIMMYLRGMMAGDICQTLNHSRPWFYRWLKRYQINPGGDWFTEQSRRPRNISTQIGTDMENLIIQIRRNLENTSYAQIGAMSIQWELQKLQIEPPPVWTIDRIIKRHGLTLKKTPINRSKRQMEHSPKEK